MTRTLYIGHLIDRSHTQFKEAIDTLFENGFEESIGGYYQYVIIHYGTDAIAADKALGRNSNIFSAIQTIVALDEMAKIQIVENGANREKSISDLRNLMI